MGSSASKEQQGCSEPAEDLAQHIFHGTALDFIQLFPLPNLLRSLGVWGGSYPKCVLSLTSSCNSLITCRACFVLRVVVAFPYMFMASANYSYGSTARHKFWRFQTWRLQSLAEPHGNDSQSYSYKNNYIARGEK